MDDLISRDFIKSLGGECIAARDSKTHELLPISSIDALPSAQPQSSQGSSDYSQGLVNDTISRQATITEIKNYERDSTAPIDYVKIVEQMPPAQPDARYINANELIKRLQQAGLDDAVSIAVKMAGHERLKHVPSAQPELIRCKDCKHCEMTDDNYSYCYSWQRRTYKGWYCVNAKKRDTKP